LDGRYSPDQVYRPGSSPEWIRSIFRRLIIPLALFATATFIDIAYGGQDTTRPYWVYFRDKGHTTQAQIDAALASAEADLTSPASRRRSRLNRNRLVDETDLPISTKYLDAVSRLTGGKTRHTSRWLNAVSCNLTPSDMEPLLQLPFVERIELVRSFVRRRPEPQPEELPSDFELPRRDEHDLEYGNSYLQNAFLNAPELHDRGYRGRGILIGITDTGFNNLEHNCFEHLDVAAAWDFLNDDDDVDDGDDMGQGYHGTGTLSIIAGLDPGHFIGVAHEASFVLAKTENTEWEREVEEDHWVAAIEWMDSLGVEVVSASLTYIDWYDYEDMDGKSAVTTIAADIAAAVGMVIVTSMGNAGREDYPDDKMGAPADGDIVFTIGATNRDSVVTEFSSHGPTWDDRIKPDFVTLGSSVRHASSVNDDSYAIRSGTSFSTPAVAGLCALLIQANPYLTPVSLRTALRQAAHNCEAPDTLIGWGIPDGLAALDEIGPEVTALVIPLSLSWNTVSHNLYITEILDIVDIFAPIVERGNLVLVKDEHGRFYYPSREYNDIPFWDPLAGYQVKVTGADTLVFEGPPTIYNEPVELSEGWHIIAYLPGFPLPPEAAFQSLVEADALQIVKDDHGWFYLPAYDFNNMPDLRPGRGYHIRLTRDAELIYHRRRAASAAPQLQPEPTYFTTPEPRCAGMSLLVITDSGISDGDEIGFLNQDGRLMGSGVFQGGRCGVALWGEATGTFPVCRIYSSLDGYLVTPQVGWIEGTPEFKPDEMAVITVSIPEGDAATVVSDLSITASPNPFNHYLNISYSTILKGSVEVSVFDLLGRKVIQRSSHGDRSGQGSVTLRSGEWSGGSYIVRLEVGGRRAEILAKHLK